MAALPDLWKSFSSRKHMEGASTSLTLPGTTRDGRYLFRDVKLCAQTSQSRTFATKGLGRRDKNPMNPNLGSGIPVAACYFEFTFRDRQRRLTEGGGTKIGRASCRESV